MDALRELVGPKSLKERRNGAKIKEWRWGMENLDCKDNREKQETKGQLWWVRKSTDFESEVLVFIPVALSVVA